MEITKRDYFAAHALTGILSASPPPEGDSLLHDHAAAAAFKYADAMMRFSRTLFDPVEIDPEWLKERQGVEGEEPRIRPIDLD